MTTEPKPEFKREHRYYVFKVKDMAYLSQQQKELINEIGEIIDDDRDQMGRGPLRCVVVESDWPEYEIVWRMIEARCTGKPIEHGFPEAKPEHKAIGWTLDYDFIEKINEAAENLGCESSTETTECVLRAAIPFIQAERETALAAANAEIARLQSALMNVRGCVDAAYIEGLADVLADSKDERLKDLVNRRLLYVTHYVDEAIDSAKLDGV